MRTETGKAIHLADYMPPDFLIERVDLDIKLVSRASHVHARLHISPNPAGRPDAKLMLDGDGLSVQSVKLNGAALDETRASITPDGLIVYAPPREAFTLETHTIVDPEANTQLSGLYRSGSAYCTQCEAEGFRRITYFLDRPDVLSVYRTRIEGDKTEAPVLLGNGNPIEAGDMPGNRHFAVWHDPFPKPSYLFALVGGNLGSITDTFRTRSGRDIALAIYVEKGKEERALYAMDALKRSMKWDEDVYGREYDLDVFNIVAVSDFNMGAMENKGLNIFNDKYVLASPDTATDTDYAHIESVIAHEYFHNWTGNRITCRDWFQLCLKEGLTVFRDQEFSADQRSRAVRRIGDVRALRAAQFVEDAGPLAHNVRPEAYQEINNFYTATVYQKGAEVIRMLKTLIGDEAFYRGMDIYFDRYDGTAATVEDFIGCFAESSGSDLSQFMRWYSQAGTPLVRATGRFIPEARSYTLDLEQEIPDTPGQTGKKPQVIPVSLGLLDREGNQIALRTGNEHGAGADELERGVFELSDTSRRIIFHDVPGEPALSLLRGFSAPVRIESDVSERDLLTIMAHDPDLFARWQAIQTYATSLMRESVRSIGAGGAPANADAFVTALEPVIAGWSGDREFTALALTLPSEGDMAREIGKDIDPDAIHVAREALRKAIGERYRAQLADIHARLSEESDDSLDAEAAGGRAMRSVALAYIAAADEDEGAQRAAAQFSSASNMTDRMGALTVLSRIEGTARDNALQAFYERYQDDGLVLDKWFAIQAMAAEDEPVKQIRALMQHPDFSMTNPNRLRSVIATFAFANQKGFNAPDGSGYDLLAEVTLELDPKNPQVAARMLTALRSWRNLEPVRRAKAEKVLRHIASQSNLSVDVRDIVSRTLE